MSTTERDTEAELVESPFPNPTLDDDNPPYWEYCKQGELRYQYCTDCERFWFPVGPVCPRCLGTNFEWRPVSLDGELLAVIVYHRKFFPNAELPYAVGQVWLKEGIRLSAQLDTEGIPAEELARVGAHVKVRFERRTSGFSVPKLVLAEGGD